MLDNGNSNRHLQGLIVMYGYITEPYHAPEQCGQFIWYSASLHQLSKNITRTLRHTQFVPPDQMLPHIQ